MYMSQSSDIVTAARAPAFHSAGSPPAWTAPNAFLASPRASSDVSAPSLPSVSRFFCAVRPPAPGRYSTIQVFAPLGITFRPNPFRSVSYQYVGFSPGWIESTSSLRELRSGHKVQFPSQRQ